MNGEKLRDIPSNIIEKNDNNVRQKNKNNEDIRTI